MADGIHAVLGVGTGLDKPCHDGTCRRIESVEGLKMQIEEIKAKELKPYENNLRRNDASVDAEKARAAAGERRS